MLRSAPATLGTIFGSLTVLSMATILTLALCAGAGLSLCSNRVDVTAMAGMDMPGTPMASMGMQHLLICPIVLTLVFVLALAAATTAICIARDSQRRVTRRLAVRSFAALPVLPMGALLGIAATLCVAAMLALDGAAIPPIVTCTAFVAGIFAVSLGAMLAASACARAIVALGVHLLSTLIALCIRLIRAVAPATRAFCFTLDRGAAALLLGTRAGLRAPPAVVR